MITAHKLSQVQLDQLYDWVDGLSLSRPKKNIARDFSDGVQMAQVIMNFYPKLVELHNYPSGKVMSKLGIHLTQEDCSRLSNATPMAVEAVLYQIKRLIDDTILLNNQENQSPKRTGGSSNNLKTGTQNQIYPKSSNKKNQGMNNRVQQLKEILNIIKDKVLMVEKSLQRKDGQIRQLQEILKQAGVN